MARISETRYFASEDDARAFVAAFLAQYAGAWNPYEGYTRLEPPCDDRATWCVTTTRNTSAN